MGWVHAILRYKTFDDIPKCLLGNGVLNGFEKLHIPVNDDREAQTINVTNKTDLDDLPTKLTKHLSFHFK